MDVLYRSKGISKAAMTKKLVSIAIFLVLAFSMVIIGSSKTKGPAQRVSIGGGSTQTIRLERDKYSAKEQESFAVLAISFGLIAVVDAGLLAGSRISWTEITQDNIHANCMGKTLSYPIHRITQVSRFGDYLFVSGSSGSVILIAADPAQVHALLSGLMKR